MLVQRRGAQDTEPICQKSRLEVCVHSHTSCLGVPWCLLQTHLRPVCTVCRDLRAQNGVVRLPCSCGGNAYLGAEITLSAAIR